MARISVGAAVGEGFSLIRRQPVAVAIWALVLWAVLALRVAVYLPLYQVFMSTIMENVRSGSSTPPNVASMLPLIQQAQALGLLLSLVQLAANAVLTCAVFRAVLRPEQNRFAYMRFGGAELFLFVFYIAFVIAIFVGVLVLAIPLGIVGAVIGNASAASGALFAVIAVFAVLAVIVWVALRLSLFGPMLVDGGEIRLPEAWALSRGHVGSLLLVGLLLVVLAIVAEMVLFSVSIAVFAAAATGGFDPAALQHATPQEVLSHVAPALGVFGGGLLLLVAVMTPVFMAPWARAYKDLRQEDVAATFG